MNTTAISLKKLYEFTDEFEKLYRLGDGAYSAVFAHPSDKNKIVRVTRGIGIKWLIFCHENWKKYIFLPRIYAYEVLASGLYVFEGERLKEMSDFWEKRYSTILNDVWSSLHYNPDAIIDDHVHSKKSSKYRRVVRSFQRKFGGINDAEAHNFMMRGRQLVINDPFC